MSVWKDKDVVPGHLRRHLLGQVGQRALALLLQVDNLLFRVDRHLDVLHGARENLADGSLDGVCHGKENSGHCLQVEKNK